MATKGVPRSKNTREFPPLGDGMSDVPCLSLTLHNWIPRHTPIRSLYAHCIGPLICFNNDLCPLLIRHSNGGTLTNYTTRNSLKLTVWEKHST